MTTDRRDLGCILLLLAIATIFFSDVLFAGSNFYYRDLFIYHFPMKRIVRDAMLSGEFPSGTARIRTGSRSPRTRRTSCSIRRSG